MTLLKPDQLFFLLETGIATRTKLRLKLFNPARSVNEFQLSCEERMTHIADINFYLRYSTSRSEGIATTTLHYRFLILWVNGFFHRVHSFD